MVIGPRMMVLDLREETLGSGPVARGAVGRTGDWVVLYVDGTGPERQYTVVTETRGPLSGERVVRGRESACRECYLGRASSKSATARTPAAIPG